MKPGLRFLFVFFASLPALAVEKDLLTEINCPAYTPASSRAHFRELNPSTRRYQGVQFPAHQNVLFRGAYAANPQFDVKKVVQGLFFEKSWYIGSPMFFLIQEVLVGNRNLQSSFFPTGGLPLTAREYFEVRRIRDDVEGLLRCRAPGYFSEPEARVLAADLMDKVLTSFSRSELTEKYFDMFNSLHYQRSLQDLGFGNNAVDFVIGSYYDQIASLYGMKTLVFQDHENRGLDLTYFNFVKNGQFYHSWVDAGEVNLPGAIDASELIGIQIRTQDRKRHGWGGELPNSAIRFAIYRHQIGKQIFAIVVDGEDKALCLLHGDDKRVYQCEKNWESPQGNLMNSIVPLPSVKDTSVRSRAALIGILNTCQNKCSELQEIENWYGKSGRKILSAELMKEMSGFEVNGQSISFYPTRGIEKPSPPAEEPAAPVVPKKIEVMRALYGNMDVTSAAAQYANGKLEVEYSVRLKHMELKENLGSQPFQIQWRCGRDEQIQISKIPSPSLGKKLTLSCREKADPKN